MTELRPTSISSTAFNPRSGSLIERALFNHRLAVIVLCALLTTVLGWQASRLRLNASFEKAIPATHPYILNFLRHQNQLSGLGNAVRIAVVPRQGTIYESAYLETLRELSDEVFLLPGVARNQMKSLWTPNTRWVGVTEEGLDGGAVIPEGFDGSSKYLDALRTNVARSGEVGNIVAGDERSSVVLVPLLASDTHGKPFDYGIFAQRIESLRAKYESRGVSIHVTGFAMIIGELIAGVRAVVSFFALAVGIATAMVFWFTRC